MPTHMQACRLLELAMHGSGAAVLGPDAAAEAAQGVEEALVARYGRQLSPELLVKLARANTEQAREFVV